MGNPTICLDVEEKANFHHLDAIAARLVFVDWLDSNFIPKNSKKFEYRNFDKAIRFYIENEPKTRKIEVP